MKSSSSIGKGKLLTIASSADLTKGLKLTPFELVKEYPYGKAIKIKEKLKFDFIELVPII